MRVRVLRNPSGRALLLLIVAAVVAAGLVMTGAGPPRQAGAAVSPGATQLVSGDGQPPSTGSGQPAISADGRYVAFSTFGSFDLLDVLRKGGSDLDVYVRDLREGTTVLLS
ncbi:MAG: hypothetical protein M3291_14580, partial [Actinomycetota bacterium]|nr:hypothetical protein [Actinomycetota bacterium]